MRILEKLKVKLENAKSTEEKKQIFLENGIEIEESELEQISAGKIEIVSLVYGGDTKIPEQQTPVIELPNPVHEQRHLYAESGLTVKDIV